MKGHRKVAITICTVIDASDIPRAKLQYDPFALQEKVEEFIKECDKDYYEYYWVDLGEE